MKEVSMTIRIDQELRVQFSAAAERDHRPAAQVVRDLMRDYVERSREQVKCSITPEERRRRQKAVDYARASIGLEGFELSEADKAHAERFIRGEIDIKEFVKVRDV